MKLLITGTAGFIGFHLVEKMFHDLPGISIVGFDAINDYYDSNLKLNRLREHGVEAADAEYGKPIASTVYPNYKFIKGLLEDSDLINSLFEKEKFTHVCNLAAQAGVRYSLENPKAYIDSNIVGFINILEACRHYEIQHLAYASSSSVYGLNETMPFSVHQNVDHPISLYAASKKSNELMAHTYSHLFNLPTTGLRFFTVYGPWGRPDMALFLFTKAILEGKTIDVYNFGQMKRDFTYVKDIVEGVKRIIINPANPNPDWNGANPDPGTSKAPYSVYNIGNNNPVELLHFIQAIENELDCKAKMNMLPLQAGDVPSTFADVNDLIRVTGFKPQTTIQEGVREFVSWYFQYYKIEKVRN